MLCCFGIAELGDLTYTIDTSTFAELKKQQEQLIHVALHGFKWLKGFC